jgi:hypothetical protein
VLPELDWNLSMKCVQAMLGCTSGELECIGEKALDGYIDDVRRVALALAAQKAAPARAGWCPIMVNTASFDNLIAAMDRAERKGYLPDAVVNEWLQFDYDTTAPSTPPSEAEQAEAPSEIRDDVMAVLIGLDVPVVGYLSSHSQRFHKVACDVDSAESAMALVREADHRRACERIAALVPPPASKAEPVAPVVQEQTPTWPQIRDELSRLSMVAGTAMHQSDADKYNILEDLADVLANLSGAALTTQSAQQPEALNAAQKADMLATLRADMNGEIEG